MTSRQASRRQKRHDPPSEVMFPVTPMLDMAFQLLAFFVLTFQAPSGESRLDLYLPAVAAALPSAPGGLASTTTVTKTESDLENDLLVRVEADELGDLKSLKLGDANVPSVEVLTDRLRKYEALLDGRPLRVRISADDRLRYEEAARIIAACGIAGASSVRLTDPRATP